MNRMEVTGLVGPGELLMVYRDPDGGNIVCHQLLFIHHCIPDSKLLQHVMTDMRVSVERYRKQEEERETTTGR